MKEVKISWKNNPVVVKLRTLNYGEYLKVQKKSSNVIIDSSGEAQATWEFTELQRNAIPMSIVEPKELRSISEVESLSVEDGEKLWSAVMEINPFLVRNPADEGKKLGNGVE